MGQLRLKGKVVYMPGPWGVNVPADQVSVQIVDLDIGNPSDTIWTGATGSDGTFQGASSEWQDRIPIKVWHARPTPGRSPAGEWVTTGYRDDPLDVLMLLACLSQADHPPTTLPFVFLGDDVMSPSLMLPWGPPQPVKKGQRASLVVTSVVSQGMQAWRLLYQFLEAAGPTLAKDVLGPAYGSFVSLAGTEATQQKFLDALENLAADQNIMAIDVILNVHGSPGTIYFDEGWVMAATLADQIQSLNAGAKLRALYSGACYGASQADAFRKAGFKVASGALGVNADAAVAYPTFLGLWGTGNAFHSAVEASSSPVTRVPQDQLARAAGFSDVNSEKQIFGQGELSITSLP
jgi:hypothetical protein